MFGMDQALNQFKTKFGEKVCENEPFALHTTLGIGGPIKIFLDVQEQEQLIESVKLAIATNTPYLIIGKGSNLLISDSGFEGLVIKNSVKGIAQDGNNLTVKSGTVLQDLVNYAIEHSLAGMNKMSGIPGTVGGAVYGDAGAYGNSIRDYLASVQAFDGNNVITLSKEECGFGYRESNFKKNKYLILEILFTGLPNANAKELKKEALEIIEKRTAKYPPDTKCPGSFFKNVVAENLSPEQLKKMEQFVTPFGKIPAGALIEAVGGKGDQIGGIKILENHGNTFANINNGTAEDFYNLAKKYYLKVKEQFGVELEPEVQLINLPPLNKP